MSERIAAFGHDKGAGKSARLIHLREPLRRLISARRAAQQPTPGPASSADEAADLVSVRRL
jgi:hypothetical protein